MTTTLTPEQAARFLDPTTPLPTPPRRASLAGFQLDDLSPFKAGGFLLGESFDYRTFYVGADDVHGVLKYLLSRCTRSLAFNMFGYDDDELDAVIRGLVLDDGVFVQGTLDKSQASGVHERKIIQAWDPRVRASFAVGESATRQISHTKGGVIDGVVAFEGSTNWSASGEGTIVQTGSRKAQNNTLLVHVNPVEVNGFLTELNEEHAVALQQQAAAAAAAAAEGYALKAREARGGDETAWPPERPNPAAKPKGA